MEASTDRARFRLSFAAEKRFLLWPAVAVGSLIAACSVAVFVLGGGHFTFAVDDPYIHLALAKQIGRGHYGINSGEFAAPSSSIIWPFLLAPFAASPLGVAAAVLFNSLCALCTVTLFALSANAVLVADDAKRKRAWVIGLTLAFAIATNQVGLALLGMEHSLQVLIAVWLATLVVRDSKHGSPPASLEIACALAVGPLVRYEMVGPSLIVAGYFVWRRRALPALVGLGLTFAALGAFSLMLLANGQGALPTSVLAKSGTSPGQALWVTAFANIRAQLHAGWAVMLALAGFVAALYHQRRRVTDANKPVAALVLLALLGHLLVGRSGWFGRYEAYALAFTYVLTLAIFAGNLSAWIATPPPLAQSLALLVFAAALSVRYAAIVVTTPLGARNIYEQQAQVARFVSSYYRQPVGVNDIGYVAWTSDNYVLDFIGLASREAFLAQRKYPTDSGAWVGGLTRAHDVRFAAIYDSWFYNLPASWLHCGWLHLGSRRITAASDVVAFYALDDATRAALPPKLHQWASSLPPGVRFEFAEGCR